MGKDHTAEQLTERRAKRQATASQGEQQSQTNRQSRRLRERIHKVEYKEKEVVRAETEQEVQMKPPDTTANTEKKKRGRKPKSYYAMLAQQQGTQPVEHEATNSGGTASEFPRPDLSGQELIAKETAANSSAEIIHETVPLKTEGKKQLTQVEKYRDPYDNNPFVKPMCQQDMEEEKPEPNNNTDLIEQYFAL